jgi:preprotein translocase subunit SecG
MDFILSALTILASILLILVVYVQNSKGGGLSSDFGAANQLGGVQKTTEFIEKLTWSLAGVIVVASILTTIRQEKPVVEEPAKQEQQKGGAPQGGQQQQQPAQ